jgi:hypothetical protein
VTTFKTFVNFGFHASAKKTSMSQNRIFNALLGSSGGAKAGLRARVSRLGGFKRLLSGQLLTPTGYPALFHRGRRGYLPLSLFLNPDGVVVCRV